MVVLLCRNYKSTRYAAFFQSLKHQIQLYLQCLNVNAYRDALTLVGEVVDQAGVSLRLLDVGGGFPADYPGHDAAPLSEYFEAIRQGVDQLGLRNDCVLMCEPGRALVADGCSLITQVLLRKETELYINDGIYGSLSELVIGKMRLPVRLIRADGEPSRNLVPFKVYGPTCDSLDVLPVPFELPEDVRRGRLDRDCPDRRLQQCRCDAFQRLLPRHLCRSRARFRRLMTGEFLDKSLVWLPQWQQQSTYGRAWPQPRQWRFL